jgi:hypothetical protein
VVPRATLARRSGGWMRAQGRGVGGWRRSVGGAGLCLLVAGCAADPGGLRRTPDGTGPMVVVDLTARPIPELPLPNDMATRADPSSPTGLRLNISTEAATAGERAAREALIELDGFAVFAPISVQFSAPVDLSAFRAGHEAGDPAVAPVLVVDITPGSPTYGQVHPIDAGDGRFPDPARFSGRYWANDPRPASHSLRFETFEEDLNGDGALQPQEDSDGDGVLDHPNVWPVGGDPVFDVTNWWESETNTLIVRPVIPMREETTYAVVLTERLVGPDGQPVRSPWPYVHHADQRGALSELSAILPDHGLSVDDVSFAWSFTTGRVTGDLRDLREGLYGRGPYAALSEDFPGGITEAIPLSLPTAADRFKLYFDDFLFVFNVINFLDEDDPILDLFASFSESMVSGAFVAPRLASDTDGDGGLHDEHWHLDRRTGYTGAVPGRVPFTCFLPFRDEATEGPAPVVIAYHGQGGSRFHMVLFAWAVNRLGWAMCAYDMPTHGGALSGSDLDTYAPILEGLGLGVLLNSFSDARAVDLDNDGDLDSGGDYFTTDAAHTRDNVRQGQLDAMQFVRSLRMCGTGQMTDVNDDGAPEVSCDWDADGHADIGGPDVDLFALGLSLGGINTSVLTAVEPELTATVPIIPGGGLGDIITRTDIGGPMEAAIGRLMTPMILGESLDGQMQITQQVVSGDNMRRVVIAPMPPEALGGFLRVENLANGKERYMPIPSDGRVRAPIAADAADAWDKRVLGGMPATGPAEGEVYEVQGNAGLGDPLRITLYDASGAELQVIDRFAADVVHEGLTYRAGSPLVAANAGFGLTKGSPELRRLLDVSSMLLEPGDPIAYAPHWFLDPYPEHGGREKNVLMHVTIGDPTVPIATGLSLARSAGFLNFTDVDPRYGTTVDRWLIDRHVVEGVTDFSPYAREDGQRVLFDPDDLDDGTDGTGAPSDAPLRVVRQGSRGQQGLRIPYTSVNGTHGYFAPAPWEAFDVALFATNQFTHFLRTGGAEIDDDPCFARLDCDRFPAIVVP